MGKRMANKPSKYKNRKARAFGRTYDSIGERDRAFYLLDAAHRGEIRNLRQQVPFRLCVNGVLICRYIADFVYEKRGYQGTYGDRLVVKAALGEDYVENWIEVVEDFKGVKTDVFKLKEKLMKACHGIEIRIVKKPTDKI